MRVRLCNARFILFRITKRVFDIKIGELQMGKKRPRDVSGRLRKKHIPVHLTDDEYRRVKKLSDEDEVSISEVFRKAAKYYESIKGKSLEETFANIVEKSKKEYFDQLKTNGYEFEDVTRILAPELEEGYFYLIKKLGSDFVSLIMPPPSLSYVVMKLESKPLEIVPDIFSKKDVQVDEISALVRKLKKLKIQYGKRLGIQCRFNEYFEKYLSHIRKHGDEVYISYGEGILGAFPTSEVVGQQAELLAPDHNTAMKDVASDYKKYELEPPENLRMSLLYGLGERPSGFVTQTHADLVGCVLFFPKSARNLIKQLLSAYPVRARIAEPKVFNPLKEHFEKWIEDIKSEFFKKIGD